MFNTLKGKYVECVDETIDSSLDFKIHTEKVSLKVNKS